jgi:hypothetical protein
VAPPQWVTVPASCDDDDNDNDMVVDDSKEHVAIAERNFKHQAR